MKKSIGESCLKILLPIILLIQVIYPLIARSEEATTLPGPQGPVTIVIFHPSWEDSLEPLLALREKGLLEISQLQVIGVYHEKQPDDFEKAREYVRENNLHWFRFHPVSFPLSEDLLFQENSATPEFKKIFEMADGIIFFGGPDIPPAIYKEKTSLLTMITDPYRHMLELSFIFHLLGGFQDENFRPWLEAKPELPVLGICLGHQSLNVGTGGTLTQDIWFEIYGKQSFEEAIDLERERWHNNPFSCLFPQNSFVSYTVHPLKLNGEGKFCALMGVSQKDKPLVYSGHHQQVERLGKGFRVIASSLDGKVTEAIEHVRFPNVLGVQFHPEYPELWDREALVKFGPGEKEVVNLRSLLEKNPPSLTFHEKLWSWFSQRCLEIHKSR